MIKEISIGRRPQIKKSGGKPEEYDPGPSMYMMMKILLATISILLVCTEEEADGRIVLSRCVVLTMHRFDLIFLVLMCAIIVR